MSEPLFYCAQPPASGDIVLADEEAHHVTVQRLRRGDAIALFDGQGQLIRGVIAAIDRKNVHVTVAERRHVAPARPRLELYCALPKGDRLATLLEMGTQLGMSKFTPLECERSVTRARADSAERWRRICLEACKQSRRVHVPEIGPAVTPAGAAAALAGAGLPLLVAHPAAQGQPENATPDAERLALFVGPEGGFTGREVEALRVPQARLVDLGDAILRVETAAIALLTLAGIGRNRR